MPYPNEHACRLRDPGDFQEDSFRRVERDHEGKKYSVIMGRLNGEETLIEQAYRYPKDTWSVDEARSHCKDHDGIEFEPAADSENAFKPEGIEHRAFQLTEIRFVETDGQKKMVGYAAVFDQLSDDLGGFQEIIRPGAFTKTLREADVRALWNHDSNYVLGRSKSGTLRLREDRHGLGVEIHPPDTVWARDLMTTMERGDVDQMSLAFRTMKDKWSSENGSHLRELLEVQLYDVSPVTFPAYPQTTIALRSAFGLCADEIMGSFHRLEAGAMTEGDIRVLRNLLETVNSRLGEEPPAGGHSDPEPEPPMSEGEPPAGGHSVEDVIAIDRQRIEHEKRL